MWAIGSRGQPGLHSHAKQQANNQSWHGSACYDPITQNAETEGPGVQGQPGLHETISKKLGKIFKKSIVKKLQRNHSFIGKFLANIQGMDILNFTEVLVSYRGKIKN